MPITDYLPSSRPRLFIVFHDYKTRNAPDWRAGWPKEGRPVAGGPPGTRPIAPRFCRQNYVDIVGNCAIVIRMKKILETSRDDTGQRCYRSLRRLIMYAQLPAGERLGEVEWSQRLGAHRSAFREALVLLAHEGLLRRGERGGFFVPYFDHNDIVEIVEARLVIELGALKLIAKKRPSAEKLAPLEELCENMRRLLGSELLLGFVEADRKFHEMLVGLAASSR